MTTTVASHQRDWVRIGLWLVGATMAYNIIEAGIALWFGAEAESIALVGFGLDSSDELPDSGVFLGDGRYFVRMINDPGDPSGDALSDENFRFIAVSRGETPDGGAAEVRVLLAAPAFPAVATNGPLSVVGNPSVLGPCAGVHANDTLTIDGHPTVDGPVTSADTVVMLFDAVVYDEAGDTVAPGYEPPVDIPDLNPLDFCYAADFELKDGWVITIDPDDASRDSAFAGGSNVMGWQWDVITNTYQLKARDAVEGTVCADGSIKVTGNLGSAADTFDISLLSTGSVQIGGTPVVQADHPEDFLIVAEGDVKLSGNSGASTPYYGGTTYAGSQCQVNGTPDYDGNILCYDAEDPLGAVDLIDENKVNGNPAITYDCSGKRRRTLVAAWWESRTNQ
jgi:hypothetical protein